MVVTVAEAAALLRVSENTIRNAIRAGQLPALRVGIGKKGGAYRILQEDLEAFVARCKERIVTVAAPLPPVLPPLTAFRHVDVSRWLAANGPNQTPTKTSNAH